MARYNYKCDACNIIEEQTHSMMEDPIFLCPQCGEKMYKYLGGAVSFVLKGDGWCGSSVEKTERKEKSAKLGEKMRDRRLQH